MTKAAESLTHPAYAKLRAVTDTASVLLADNPGLLTLEGTNTWVLRGPRSDELVIVDPGPDDDGHIAEWPVGELSVFDADGPRQPANRYAVAVPVLKAVYDQAGIALPDDIATEPARPEAEPEATTVAASAVAKARAQAILTLIDIMEVER